LINQDIFRTYDIRGIVGEDLTEEVAYKIGKAYGGLLREENDMVYGKVAVGKDTRQSSNHIAHALAEGIFDAGFHVYDLGACVTPALYFYCHTQAVDGGIMVTGSHNPPEYNGFKVCVGKEAIYGEQIQKLAQKAEEEQHSAGPSNGETGVANYQPVLPSYLDYLKDEFAHLKELNQKRGSLAVGVDAGNAAAGLVMPELLEALGFEVHPLYCDLDPEFPNHHPDPTQLENLKDLRDMLQARRLEVGLSFDGDADRLGVVDEVGGVVWGDRLMVLYAQDILQENSSKQCIIGEVKCSQVMYDQIERLGGRALMWKTGHSLIKKKMKEENAVLAGEMSGHLFFADRYFGYDDAVYAGLRLLEILLKKQPSLSELLKDLPETSVTPELRVECADNKKFQVVERLKGAFQAGQLEVPFNIREIYTIDGLRVVFQEGWGLVRASNTQPALVMRFEAENEDLLQQYKDWMTDLVEKIVAQVEGGQERA